MMRQMLYFLVIFLFIGCGEDVGSGRIVTPTETAPTLTDRENMELVKGESALIHFSNSGSPVTSCSVTPALPSGLTLEDDCTIKGTPTTNQTLTTYVVKGVNSFGSDEAKIDISIITSSSTNVVVSGVVTYDFVPFKSGLNSGLDYSNITKKSIRGALIEIINGSGAVIGTTYSDANGFYSLSVKGTTAKVRVSAKLFQPVRSGKASWDFQVKDNTNNDALYVMEGSLASLGTKGRQTRNLNAPSGWDGSSYSSTRVAAPFAILDVIYQAIEKVRAAQNDAVFSPLNIFWSKNNVAASGETSLGQIVTSNFDGEALYILGAENSDTDEYDSAIIGHEWGHYYESVFSRSDSIGGSHGNRDMLDIRLAFGEGFGTAMGCIIIDSPLYIDSYGTHQTQSFGDDLETKTPASNHPGWFNEASIYRILYDIYDDDDDVGDTLSLGFTPIHKVLIDAQKNTKAFTSLFTFITALKEQNPNSIEKIDSIVSNENIASITDIYGTGRVNRAYENANPLYYDLSVGSSVEILTNNSAIATSIDNRLGAYNFVKFYIPEDGTYTFNINQEEGKGNPDPDFFIYKGAASEPIASAEAEGVTDTLTINLSRGHYRMSVIVYNQATNSRFKITLD